MGQEKRIGGKKKVCWWVTSPSLVPEPSVEVKWVCGEWKRAAGIFIQEKGWRGLSHWLDMTSPHGGYATGWTFQVRDLTVLILLLKSFSSLAKVNYMYGLNGRFYGGQILSEHGRDQI